MDRGPASRLVRPSVLHRGQRRGKSECSAYRVAASSSAGER